MKRQPEGCSCPAGSDPGYRTVNRETGGRGEVGHPTTIVICAGCGNEIEL